ncbi:MAG: hypothetical protein PUB42_06085 [Firmicutes bacterium]|nr:hypothetical protein [Bacillota bacterium]
MRYDGNLAYELDFETNDARINKKVQERKKEIKIKAKAISKRKHQMVAACVLVLAMSAGFMISRDVTVYEGENKVQKLQKNLNELKEYSSQKAFELDQSLDLENVEKIASEKLGMTHPEKYQTIYVNIKQDDVTEVTANQVEGAAGFFSIFGRKK